MVSLPPSDASLQAEGIRVEVLPGVYVASLRYFEPHGDFSALVRQIAGRELPQPLQASSSGGMTGMSGMPGLRCVLAWRSPTETLLLSDDAGTFAKYREGLAGAADGCLVDQTGGFRVLRVRGPKTHDLLQRLGSEDSIPGEGAALAGRLAELHVLTLCVETGTLLLVVERSFLGHLLHWIEITIADWTDGGAQ